MNVRRPDALSSRPAFQLLISACSIATLAWFSMKFYMDNSNDSETEGYVRALIASATHGTISLDATGHYSALAPYVLWPFPTLLQHVTGAYQIRGYVFTRLLLGVVLFAAAYVWYRRVGLGSFATLLGLVLLSTSFAFAGLIHGWELDQLIEPSLYLLAAIAVWNRRYLAVIALAALATANGETGALVAIVALAGLAQQDGGLRSAIKRWPFWTCAIVCAVEVALFRQSVPAPTIRAWQDLNLERLVYVIGGLCLLPLLAAAWVRSAPVAVARLFYLLAPVWIVLALATDRLEQGAAVLTPLALLFVPVALMGVAEVVRMRRPLAAPPV